MKSVKLIPVIIFFALFIFPVMPVSAAEVSLNMASGRVYAFTNADKRTISYISLSGGGKYEYAVQNADGQTVDYGVSAGRCPVRGGGITYVSIQGEASVGVTYDGAKISYTDEEGAALHRVTLGENETALLTNNHFEQLSVSVDNSARGGLGHSEYDVVVRDSRGDVTLFAADAQLSMQNIPASCSASLTAGKGGLVLIVPQAWMGNEISVTVNYEPALISRPLSAGQTVTIQNIDTDNSYEPKIFLDEGIFYYDYLLRDVKGYTLKTESGIKGDKLTVNASNTIIVTPRPGTDGAVLIYPSDWSDELVISGANGDGSVSDETYSVPPSSTLVILNADEEESHAVQIANKQSDRDYTFDYVLTDADGITYKWEYYATEMTIPPTGTLTLTPNKNETLQVKLPAASGEVTAESNEIPSLTFVDVPKGRSIIFHSTHFGEYPITPRKDVLPGKWDYILKDEAGKALDYSGIELGDIYPLNQNETLHFTNTEDFDAQVVFPTEWTDNGLAYEFSSAPALFRTVVTEGKSVSFHNTRKFVGEEIKIETESEKPSVYDYMHALVIGSKSGLLDVGDYGVAEAGTVELYNDGIYTLSPHEGSAVSVCYPYELSKRWIKVEEDTLPLRHIVVRPNERLTFDNRLYDDEFSIQNNTEDTLAGYYIFENDEPTNVKKGAEPLDGVLTVPPRISITIVAAEGLDLELWMPEAWAKQLIK